MKILIVDDEPLIRRSLARAAASFKHEVFEAKDGIEGLDMWREHCPDLVFLDILMPGIKGPQVIKERGSHNSKVVLISAYSGDFETQSISHLGADLFIKKPFDDIFDVIKQAEAICE